MIHFHTEHRNNKNYSRLLAIHSTRMVDLHFFFVQLFLVYLSVVVFFFRLLSIWFVFTVSKRPHRCCRRRPYLCYFLFVFLLVLLLVLLFCVNIIGIHVP